jgi:predicted O-methyltransferase YrrM
MLRQLAAKLGRRGEPHPSEIVGATVSEYERARRRFERRIGARRQDWLEEYEQAGGDCFGAVGIETAAHLFALVRSTKPETVVETGVCNGVSTLAVLWAIELNGHGHLYSVDLPFYTDESLDEFRHETFEGFGGAAVPEGKEPGWIVPEQLHEYWTFVEGRSQEELPRLLPEIAPIDMFVHDSEHSAPCQMFEYELAWAHLGSGGLLVSDDINWTRAFEMFVDVRGDGAVARPVDGLGAIRKPGEVNK